MKSANLTFCFVFQLYFLLFSLVFGIFFWLFFVDIRKKYQFIIYIEEGIRSCLLFCFLFAMNSITTEALQRANSRALILQSLGSKFKSTPITNTTTSGGSSSSTETQSNSNHSHGNSNSNDGNSSGSRQSGKSLKEGDTKDSNSRSNQSANARSNPSTEQSKGNNINSNSSSNSNSNNNSNNIGSNGSDGLGKFVNFMETALNDNRLTRRGRKHTFQLGDAIRAKAIIVENITAQSIGGSSAAREKR